MRNIMILVALGFALSAALPALASDHGDRQGSVDVPRDQWLSIAEISKKLADQGYDIRKIKSDDGVYEVDAIDKAGARIEAYVHPVTGEILEFEIDD